MSLLRVAVVAIVIFAAAVMFLFALFFFVFFPQENMASNRETSRVSVKVFWIHSVHAQWYASSPFGNDTVQWLSRCLTSLQTLVVRL